MKSSLFFIFHNIQSGKFKILFIHSFEVSYSVFFCLQDKIAQDLINHFCQSVPRFLYIPWIFLMVRSYVSLTSINFLNVGGVFLNEILLSYLEAGSGVVKFYKIEFWVEVTFFILLLRASKHSQLLLFSKNGIWWGKKNLVILVV